MDENQRNARVVEELLLAEQAHQSGEFETALAHCLRAITANPVSVPAYQSAGRICMLLERLKEDKAAEEEREAWADLLKRLDKWIEALRGELPESERVPRTEGAAAGERMGEYKT